LAAESGEQGKFASSSAMSSLYSDQMTAQEVADLHRELFAPLGRALVRVRVLCDRRFRGGVSSWGW